MHLYGDMVPFCSTARNDEGAEEIRVRRSNEELQVAFIFFVCFLSCVLFFDCGSLSPILRMRFLHGLYF